MRKRKSGAGVRAESRIRSVTNSERWTMPALRRLVAILARPLKNDRGRGGVVIQPYRGYGSTEEVFLMGRVFRQPSLGSGVRQETIARDLLDIFRRLLRWGVRNATVTASYYGSEQRILTDRDGYFRMHMRPAHGPDPDRVWHPIALTLQGREREDTSTKGVIFVPPATARFVVISDIDDTIMKTGVANKAVMLWRLFAQRARSRVAFPGVAALYNALHQGASGAELNPMLYVSRAPWSIYDVLEEFFKLHGIPAGPVLFLREWGLTVQSPLPRRAKDHKLSLIRDMLALYSDLPFILIGDSGQRDPEIYAQVLREKPGRVLAIYIRNVSRDVERRRAIEALAMEVVDAGGTLLLAADSLAMAKHAIEHDLIAPAALASIVAERTEQMQIGEAGPKPTHDVTGPTPTKTREALRQGDLQQALDPQPGERSPPNVVVETTDSGMLAASKPGQPGRTRQRRKRR